MPYLRLPNDSYVEVPEGMSREEALAIAKERFPNLYSPQTFSQRLGRAGVRGIEALAESAKGLGLFGRAVSGDTEGAQRIIEEMRKEAVEESKKPQPLSVEELKNIYASQGFGEMAGKIPAYVAEQVAQNLPSMAAPIGAASLAAKVHPLLGVGAGIGTYGLQQLGQFMQTQALTKDRTAETLEPGKAAGAAALTAPLGFLVDRFVFGLGRVGPEAAKQALVKELASRSAAGAAGRGAVRGLAEVPTELIETAAERAQAGLSLTDAEAKKQYIETAASAGVVGPSISAVSGYRERGQAKDIQEDIDLAARRERMKAQQAKDEEAAKVEVPAEAQAIPEEAKKITTPVVADVATTDRYLDKYRTVLKDFSPIEEELAKAKENKNLSPEAFVNIQSLYNAKKEELKSVAAEAKAAGVHEDYFDVAKRGYVNVLESLRKKAEQEMGKKNSSIPKLNTLAQRIKNVDEAYQRSPEFQEQLEKARKERADTEAYAKFVNTIEEYVSDPVVQKNYEDAARVEREQNIAKLKELDDRFTQLKNEGRAESVEGIRINDERKALQKQIGKIETAETGLPAQYGLEDYTGMLSGLETERKKKALAQQRLRQDTKYGADIIIDKAAKQAQQAPIETLLGTSGQKLSFPKLDTQIQSAAKQENALSKRLKDAQTALDEARQEIEKQKAELKEQARSTEKVKLNSKYIKDVEKAEEAFRTFRDTKATELGIPRWYLDEKLAGTTGSALFKPAPEIPPEAAPDIAPLLGPEARKQRETLKRPSIAAAAPEATLTRADELRQAWVGGKLTGNLSDALGLGLDSTLNLNTVEDAQKAIPIIGNRIAELTEKRRDLWANLRVPTEETTKNRAAMSAELANAESALAILKDLQNKANQTLPKEAEQKFVRALEELPEEKLNKQQLRNRTAKQIEARVELLNDFIGNITRLRQGKYAEVTSQETTTRDEIVDKAKEQVEGILWSLKRESDFIHREFSRAPLPPAEITARTKDLKAKLLRLIDTAVPTTSDTMARLRRQMAEARGRAKSLGVATTNEIKRIRREMQEAAGEGKPQVSEVRGVSKKEVMSIENSVNAVAKNLIGIDRIQKQLGPWALTQPSAKFAQIDTSTQGILNKLSAAQRRLGREVPEFEEVKRAIEDGVTSKTLLDEARQAAEATLLGREVDLGAIQEELRALQQAPVGTEESGQRAMFDVLGVARTTPKRFENIKAREKYKYEQEQARQKADAERTEELKRLERVAAWQKQKAEEEANRIRIGGAYKVYTSETLGRVKAPDFADIEVDGKVVRHVPYKTGLETTQFVETKERGRPTQTLEYVSAVPSRGTQKPTPKAEILRSKAQQMAEEFEKDAEKRINEIYASLDKEADEWRKKADDTLASIRSYRADITKKGLSLTEGELQTKYDKLAELQKDVDFYTAQARTVKTDTFRNSIKENDVILQRINKLIDSFKETEKQLTAKAEAAKVRAFKNAVGKSLDALAKNIKDQKAALKAQPSVSVAPRVLVRKEMRVKKPLPGTELGKIQEQLNALKERIKANRKILGESTQKQISAWDATFIPRDVEGGFKNMADWLNTPEKRAAHLQKMQDIEQYLELDSRMVESYLSEVVQKTNDIKDRWAEVELKATNERTLKAKIERKLYNESTNAIKALTKGIERISKATTEINATQLKGVGKLKVKFKDIEELNKKEVNAFVKKVISQKNKDGIDINDFTEQLEKLSKAKATLKKKLKTAEEALKRAVAAQTTSAKNLRDMGAAVDTSTLSAKDKKDLADKVKVTQEALETLGRLPEDYEVIRKTHVKTEGFYKSFRTLESPETPTTAEGKELSQAQAEAAQDQVTFRSRYKYPEEFIKQYGLNPEEAQGFREYLKDSKYDRDDAAERPATEADRGIDLKAASEVAARVQKALPKNIEFVYAETVAKAPVEFQVALYKKGGMAKGMVTPDGKVVVIGEAHASVKDLEETIAHELIGHYGVDVVLGPKRMQALVDRLFKQGEQHVADVATALGVFPDVETALAATDIMQNTDAKMAVVREMIAHAAEPRRVAPTFTQKVKAFIQDMVAAVRSWFRSLGMSDMAKRDTKEIQALIREAAKSLAAGRLGQYTAPAKTPAFRTAKGKMPAGFEAVKEAADAFIHQDAPLKQRILGTATGMSFKQTYVDSLAPTEEILMKNWDNKKAQQAMFSLQQYQDMLTLASAAAENGALQKVKNADGSYTIKSVEGPSLKSSVEALRPLLKMGFDAEGANRLATAYVGALRAEEEGYQKLNYDPEVIKLIKEVVPVVRANPEVKAVLDDFLDQWNAFNKGNLKLLLDTGKITKELYDELAKKKNYIPYYRNVDGELMLYLGDENPIRLGNMTDAQYLQPLIGGDDKILDFFSSGMKNTVLLTDLAVRNEAAQRLGVAMQDLKLGKIIPGMATGKNIVPYNIDGKPFYLRVETDGTAFEGVAPEMVIKGLNGMTLIIPDWLRMVNLPARLLRKGITLDPTYPFRNLYKDALSQGALKGVSGSNFKNLLTAFSNYMFKGKEIEELQRKGVIQSRLYTGTMEDVAAAQRRVVKGANLFSKYVAGQELRAARADGAVRLMLYEHFLKNGMGEGEALFATSKSMAYTRHGTSPGMRYLASMIPFFDAQVTALSSLHDSFNKKMPWDKKLNLKKKLWSAGMMMSLSTLVYSAMVSDEDWYKDMPEETRLRNWLIKLPWLDTPLALPIPFEFGVIFKALPEAIYGGMFTDTAEGAKMRDAMRQIILSSIPGGIIPIEQVPVFKAVPAGPMAATAFLPIIEIASNRSTYNQRPLETARDLAVLPEDRAREGTSEVSKRLAQLTGVSPILTDHAIRGYTGTLGPALVALVDTITGPAEAGPAAAEQPLNKWPILSQFFKTGDGGAIIDLVMDTVTKESRYTESYKKYLAEGKDQKAAEFMRDYESEIRRGSVADKLRERLGKYAAAERAIKNSDYTPAQKAEEIKNLRKAKNEDFRQLKESLAI